MIRNLNALLIHHKTLLWCPQGKFLEAHSLLQQERFLRIKTIFQEVESPFGKIQKRKEKKRQQRGTKQINGFSFYIPIVSITSESTKLKGASFGASLMNDKFFAKNFSQYSGTPALPLNKLGARCGCVCMSIVFTTNNG